MVRGQFAGSSAPGLNLELNSDLTSFGNALGTVRYAFVAAGYGLYLDGVPITYADTGATGASSGAATLNKYTGTVTSEALTTAAGAIYTLTLTNDHIEAGNRVFVSLDNGSNTTEGITLLRTTVTATQAVILVKNTHASSALNGTIKITFMIIK